MTFAIQYDIDSFNETKTDEVEYNFLDTRLSSASVALAKGNDVICVFVNDKADADTLQKMKDENIKVLALRVSILSAQSSTRVLMLGAIASVQERIMSACRPPTGIP